VQLTHDLLVIVKYVVNSSSEVADDDEMFMTRSLSIMPKTTEQHLI